MPGTDSRENTPEARTSRPAPHADPSGRQPGPLLPGYAALLSFFVPGLGQLAAGRLRRAVAIALPAILLVAGVVVALLVDRHGLVTGLLSPGGLAALLAIDAALFLYRAWAILDAYLVAGGSVGPALRSRRFAPLGSLALVAVLLVSSLAIHGYVAASDASVQSGLAGVFNPAGPSWLGADANATVPPNVALTTIPPAGPVGSPSGSPATASSSPSASSPPVVYALGDLPGNATRSKDWAADGYLNVLLIGADQGPQGNRMSGLRPDTMILLEVKLATGQAAMYGIPRDLINVPLPAASARYYACHCYGPAPGSGQLLVNYLIDYLWQEAALIHPGYYAQYGTGNTWAAAYVRGIDALEGAVGALTGVSVDGAVVVNLQGFVSLINALAPGGVSVNVPYEVKQDPQGMKDSTGAPVPGYEPPNGGPDIWGIDFKPGLQTMNGDQLLEFARLRHVVGYESDYYRMGRQQLVLKAVRSQLAPCALLPRIPQVMSALSGALWTDLPLSALPQFAALAQHVGTANIASYTLDPSTTGATYDVLSPASVATIHGIVARGLDRVPAGIAGPSGGSGGGAGLSC